MKTGSGWLGGMSSFMERARHQFSTFRENRHSAFIMSPWKESLPAVQNSTSSTEPEVGLTCPGSRTCWWLPVSFKC